MSRDRAMELYVDELKKIIETMSYTDNVAEFMDSVSELDGVDVDDLEAVAPEAIKKVRSQPNSPFGNETYYIQSQIIILPFQSLKIIHFISYNACTYTASRESSPIRAGLRNGLENGFTNGHTNGNGVHLQNGHSNATEHSDDEYIDTVEVKFG